MKKIKLILATMVGTMLLGSTVFGQEFTKSIEATPINQIEIEQMISNGLLAGDTVNFSNYVRSRGVVQAIFSNEEGTTVLLKGDSGETLFRVDKSTILKGELAVGKTVDIAYDGILTRSIPGQGNAFAIQNVEASFSQRMYGELVSVSDKKIVVKDRISEELMEFNVTDRTFIEEMAKVGMDVSIGYEETSEAKKEARYVESNVLDAMLELSSTKGEVVEITKHKGEVSYTVFNGITEVIFHVEDGGKVDSNIAVGDIVFIEHAPIFTLSLPAQGNAKTIKNLSLDATNHKDVMEGTIVEVNLTNEAKEILVKDNNGREIAFKITDKTIKNFDYRVGEVVTVGFNGIVTMSLPAQAVADIVVEKKFSTELMPYVDYASHKKIMSGTFLGVEKVNGVYVASVEVPNLGFYKFNIFDDAIERLQNQIGQKIEIGFNGAVFEDGIEKHANAEAFQILFLEVQPIPSELSQQPIPFEHAVE